MVASDLRNILTTRNSFKDGLSCLNMALKLPQYFYLLIKKPVGCYFEVRSHFYQEATRKHRFPYPQGDISGLRQPIKDKHQD